MLAILVLSVYLIFRTASCESVDAADDYLEKARTTENYEKAQKYLMRALSLYQKNMLKTKDYLRKIEIDEKIGTAYFYLGKTEDDADKQQEYYNSAVEYLHNVVLLKKESDVSPSVYFFLGMLYYLKGNETYDKAEENFKKALHFGFNKPELRCCLGNIYISKGKIIEAISEYKTALHFNPDDLILKYNYARALKQSRQMGPAIETFESIMDNEELSMDLKIKIHYELGLCYYVEKNYQKAIDNYLMITRISPEETKPHLYLGRLYMEMNRDEDGKREFKEALELDPGDREAKELLGKIEKESKKRSKKLFKTSR